MATVCTFLGILLVSLVVALLAGLQLGDFFGANDEFVLVIAAVVTFSVASLAVFTLAYAVARHASVLIWVALALAVLALAPVVLPGFVQKIADSSTNPYTVGIENRHITLELVVPALLVVLVQWGLIRRSWLRSAGDHEFTRWPWVTTALAGLTILNPFGLAFLSGTLAHDASDLMWEFTATVTGVALGGLLVMAWVECYIKDRMLNRRPAAKQPAQDSAPEPRSGEAETAS
ncbi:MAG: hypothetical protein WCG92_22560 [Hyphomicrobiales bacterium]|nr:hypothetical protein [Alphaproteobacteria bacterium]